MVSAGATIIFAAVAETLFVSIAVPQYLAANPLLWTLLRAITLNIVIYAIYSVAIWPFFFSPLRHLPNPGHGQFLLGYGSAMFQKPPGQHFLRWMRDIPNDGLIYFRGFLYRDRILITSPKILGEILVTKSYDFVKPKPVRDFLRQVLGDGLIVVEGDVHKFQRKHIREVFQFGHIKELYPLMYRKAKQMAGAIQAEIKEAASEKQSANVEINHWANKVTMDIIGVAGLGRDFNVLHNSDDELIRNYEELLEPSKSKTLFFLLQVLGPAKLVSRLPWRESTRFKAVTHNLDRICIDLVKAKKLAIEKGGEEHLDILSVLIGSNNFSDQELSDQTLTFLAAGHETTSSAFTWLTYLLATHPDIQARLRDELLASIPDPLTPAAQSKLADILESLPLLNAVCNETLRLYPTIPITLRQAVRPTTLNDQFIPPSTQIILSPWAINRSPDLWGPNAAEFVPERWINLDGTPNKTGGHQSAFALLTFLHGPRGCIGANFAKAELRCIAAVFVRAFYLELADPEAEVVPAGVVTTKPRDGMHLRLTPVS
ncbi:putative P450 monooxygenase [Myriangium duriaei CBS 260.36]|uniref:P450 monooxygenase n=1 Tax=Myriangium duriaei CBS 260.36 TaxID=1168546 RepID=A0A9P4JB35_9PEZI|nr:putative P450 monooxygenase [Myriangium duriaei CBS 260.36]